MRTLKMSWTMEQGRLVCRWVESENKEKSGAVLMGVAQSGACDSTRNPSLAPLFTSPNWRLGAAA
jgi:hypothetical protein